MEFHIFIALHNWEGIYNLMVNNMNKKSPMIYNKCIDQYLFT